MTTVTIQTGSTLAWIIHQEMRSLEEKSRDRDLNPEIAPDFEAVSGERF